MAVLRYGNNLSVQLECAEGAALAELGVPRGQPLADLGAATVAALTAPIDYPTLAQCTTPGDRVVVALDRGIPQVAEVTAAVIDALSMRASIPTESRCSKAKPAAMPTAAIRDG